MSGLKNPDVINGLRLALKLVVDRYKLLPLEEQPAFKAGVSVVFDDVNAEIQRRDGTPVAWPLEATE